jgi:hypothetical protein
VLKLKFSERIRPSRRIHHPSPNLQKHRLLSSRLVTCFKIKPATNASSTLKNDQWQVYPLVAEKTINGFKEGVHDCINPRKLQLGPRFCKSRAPGGSFTQPRFPAQRSG